MARSRASGPGSFGLRADEPPLSRSKPARLWADDRHPPGNHRSATTLPSATDASLVFRGSRLVLMSIAPDARDLGDAIAPLWSARTLSPMVRKTLASELVERRLSAS